MKVLERTESASDQPHLTTSQISSPFSNMSKPQPKLLAKPVEIRLLRPVTLNNNKSQK